MNAFIGNDIYAPCLRNGCDALVRKSEGHLCANHRRVQQDDTVEIRPLVAMVVTMAAVVGGFIGLARLIALAVSK